MNNDEWIQKKNRKDAKRMEEFKEKINPKMVFTHEDEIENEIYQLNGMVMALDLNRKDTPEKYEAILKKIKELEYKKQHSSL